jgi:predicted phage tail protein
MLFKTGIIAGLVAGLALLAMAIDVCFSRTPSAAVHYVCLAGVCLILTGLIAMLMPLSRCSVSRQQATADDAKAE